jgi:hypothetical protein
VIPQEQRKPRLLNAARSEVQDRLRRLGFGGRELNPIQFEKQYSHHEARGFIPVDKRMILDNTGRIGGGPIDDVFAKTVESWGSAP